MWYALGGLLEDPFEESLCLRLGAGGRLVPGWSRSGALAWSSSSLLADCWFKSPKGSLNRITIALFRLSAVSFFDQDEMTNVSVAWTRINLIVWQWRAMFLYAPNWQGGRLTEVGRIILLSPA